MRCSCRQRGLSEAMGLSQDGFPGKWHDLCSVQGKNELCEFREQRRKDVGVEDSEQGASGGRLV